MAEIKISELQPKNDFSNLWTIGTDMSTNRSVRVSLDFLHGQAQSMIEATNAANNAATNAEARMNSADALYDRVSQQLNECIRLTREAYENAEESAQRCETARQHAEDGFATMQTDIADNQSGILSHTATIADLSARLATAETDIADNNSEIPPLKQRMATAEEDIDDNKADIATIKSKVANLQSNVQTNTIDITTLTDTARIANEKATQAANETQSLVTAMMALEDEADRIDLKVSEAKRDAENAINIVTSLGTIYSVCDTLTAQEINELDITNLRIGSVYTLADEGTLAEGSLHVNQGDEVAWSGGEWRRLGADIDKSLYMTREQVEAEDDRLEDLINDITAITETQIENLFK